MIILRADNRIVKSYKKSIRIFICSKLNVKFSDFKFFRLKFYNYFNIFFNFKIVLENLCNLGYIEILIGDFF